MTTNNAHPNRVQWEDAAHAIETAQSILIVTHVNPDGDAIGSSLGLANALRERGKKVDVAVDGGVPEFLSYIPGAQTVQSSLESGAWDVMLSLDASDAPRTGDVGAFGRAHSAKVINVDHHETNDLFGDIFLVVPEVASTAEIIFDWLTRIGHPISRETAISLLTGLVTDTRGFRTSNTKPSTLNAAQRLMDAGAPLSEISIRTLESRPFSTIELWRHALQSLELKKWVASAAITQENLKQAQIADLTDGGLVGLLISANQVMIAIVFKEKSDGRVEISMRSKPGFDVAQVAVSLGGGGHKQAAGATIDGPLDAAKARVLPMLDAAVKAGDFKAAQI